MWLLVPSVRADFVYVANYAAGTVAEYTTSGQLVNPALISGLSLPSSIAVSGSKLFVGSIDNFGPAGGKIGEYTTSGQTLNASLITGLSEPVGLSVSGSDLYVADVGTGKVGKYTTSGETVNASLITGVVPQAIAVSGTDLYVAGVETIGKYTTSGARINSSLIPLATVQGLAVSGSDLFAVVPAPGSYNGRIAEYTTLGALVNRTLITGLLDPAAIAISGEDVFVTSSTPNGSIGEYTTTGGVVNAGLVTTGLNRPNAIAIGPGPTAAPLPPACWQFAFAMGGILLLSLVRTSSRAQQAWEKSRPRSMASIGAASSCAR
jgi:hypothetical protein